MAFSSESARQCKLDKDKDVVYYSIANKHNCERASSNDYSKTLLSHNVDLGVHHLRQTLVAAYLPAFTVWFDA